MHKAHVSKWKTILEPYRCFFSWVYKWNENLMYPVTLLRMRDQSCFELSGEQLCPASHRWMFNLSQKKGWNCLGLLRLNSLTTFETSNVLFCSIKLDFVTSFLRTWNLMVPNSCDYSCVWNTLWLWYNKTLDPEMFVLFELDSIFTGFFCKLLMLLHFWLSLFVETVKQRPMSRLQLKIETFTLHNLWIYLVLSGHQLPTWVDYLCFCCSLFKEF